MKVNGNVILGCAAGAFIAGVIFLLLAAVIRPGKSKQKLAPSVDDSSSTEEYVTFRSQPKELTDMVETIGASGALSPCFLTRGESEYWKHARGWGLSEVNFQRLRLAWTVTRRGTDKRLSMAIGGRYKQLGGTVLRRIGESGLEISAEDAIEVDMLYRECCAELLLDVESVDEEKNIVNLWLKVMKV
jgi:hypothetical protein